MAREPEGIRDLIAEQIERLEKIFPGKNHLWQKEIADAFEISTASVRRWYGVDSKGIDLISFAWLLARRACQVEKQREGA